MYTHVVNNAARRVYNALRRIVGATSFRGGIVRLCALVSDTPSGRNQYRRRRRPFRSVVFSVRRTLDALYSYDTVTCGSRVVIDVCPARVDVVFLVETKTRIVGFLSVPRATFAAVYGDESENDFRRVPSTGRRVRR